MGSDERTRDLVLAPGRQAFLHDVTSGNVRVFVGPIKSPIGENNKPVKFDPKTGSFDSVGLDQSIQPVIEATEEQYIILHNPAKGELPHPKTGAEATQVELEHGKVVVIHGPENFALWPGQYAEVVNGHALQLNQYIAAEVYNEDEARTNWGQSVQKPQAPTPPPLPIPPAPSQPTGEGDTEEGATTEGEAGAELAVPVTQVSVRTAGTLAGIDPQKLVTGQHIVIPGTETSFYMPCTGVRVLKAAGEQRKAGEDAYVEEAVTLACKEYCTLHDQRGADRYVEGEALVFPSPTEEFVRRDDGSKVYKAFELNPHSGVYVKVISDYEGPDGKTVEAGTELFITGEDQPFYVPRPEHMMLQYGDQYVHFAVAIPPGEGRYVLNRDTSVVDLIRGPKMLLPDPRTQVIVRRILDEDIVKLLYPGNAEALARNLLYRQMQQEAAKGSADVDYLAAVAEEDRGVTMQAMEATRGVLGAPTKPWVQQPDFAGAAAQRRTTFTPPRSITLDTKYEGAVMLDVWRGYAVSIVSKTGERRGVVVGPQTVLLQYGETVEAFELLTGTPKKEPVKRDVFLRVSSNTVTDQIDAETADLCQVRITLVLRVNFEGDDPERWFAVENYIKLLVDHIRSLVRGTVKQHGITTFYHQSTPILRDAILGVAQEDQPRPGRAFAENGMRVYDVEVSNVQILDSEVSAMLQGAQRDAFSMGILQQQLERQCDAELAKIATQTQLADAKHEATLHTIGLDEARGAAATTLALAASDRSKQEAEAKLEATRAAETIDDLVANAQLIRNKAISDQRQAEEEAKADLNIKVLQGQAAVFLEQAKALSPEIVAALQHFSDADLTGRAAEAMAPLAILGGKSVVDVLSQMFKGTPLAPVVQALGDKAAASKQD